MAGARSQPEPRIEVSLCLPRMRVGLAECAPTRPSRSLGALGRSLPPPEIITPPLGCSPRPSSMEVRFQKVIGPHGQRKSECSWRRGGSSHGWHGGVLNLVMAGCIYPAPRGRLDRARRSPTGQNRQGVVDNLWSSVWGVAFGTRCARSSPQARIAQEPHRRKMPAQPRSEG